MIFTTLCEDGTPLGKRFLQRWHVSKNEQKASKQETSLHFSVADYEPPLYNISQGSKAEGKDIINFHYDDEQKSVVELFASDQSVVYSRNGQVIKMFQGEYPIEAAFMTQFYSFPKRPTCIFEPEDFLESNEDFGEANNAVCILEDGKLRVYYDNGEDFIVTPLFEVKTCFASKYGIIFETLHTNQSKGEPLPTWFCLLNPLDDMTRIAVRHKDRIKELHTEELQIVFVSKEPSLCLAFNKSTGQHMIFFIRRSTYSETLEVEELSTQVQHHVTSVEPSLKLNESRKGFESFNAAKTPNRSVFRGRSHENSPNTFGSPSSSFPSSSLGKSFGQSKIQSASLSPYSSLGNICRSPATSSPMSSLMHFKYPSAEAASFIDASTVNHSESPDIALTFDHSWTEPFIIAKQNHGKMASKGFVAKDSVGNLYLHYLQKEEEQLAIVKIETSSKQGGFRFSAVSHIPASDAVPVSKLSMILVLEPLMRSQDNISYVTLYSGKVKVGRVIMNSYPGNNAQLAHIAHEISTLNLDSQPGTPLALGQSKAPPPPSGSLVTSSRPPSAALNNTPGFNESMISPVPQVNHEPRIISLVASLQDQVTLRYSNGNLVKIFLPSASSSPLVNDCISAICSGLTNKEQAVVFQAKWFSCRNAPGPTSINPSKEWKLFTQCLLGLLGYQTEHFVLYPNDSEHSSPAPTTSKKQRRTNAGSDVDWDFLLSSVHHQETGQRLSDLLGIEAVSRPGVGFVGSPDEEVTVDPSSPMFHEIPSIVEKLHFLYEEMKLNKCMSEHLQYLAGLLVRLTADLDLPEYVYHYWRDFPLICPHKIEEAKTRQMSKKHLAKLKTLKAIQKKPPNILAHLYSIIRTAPPADDFSNCSRLLESPLFQRSRDIAVCYGILTNRLQKKIEVGFHSDSVDQWIEENLPLTKNSFELLVRYMVYMKYDLTTLNTLPNSLSLPLLRALSFCMRDPSSHFDQSAFTLIGREDLVEHLTVTSVKTGSIIPVRSTDGMEDMETNKIIKLRWPKDYRILHVKTMLDSSSPVPITVEQKPEVSDHDFVEEQERALLHYCYRTMALPVGRGAFTLFSATASLNDTMPIPRVCLSGKAPPRDTVVELEHIDVVPNMERWSIFHNGVAAGLRLCQGVVGIDSTWILFNKPKDGQNPNAANDLIEHAGFLMALGLGGHLEKLGQLDSYDYLVKGNEFLIIGLLIGIAASKRGTMDILATKKVATQLVALLPPTATELPLAQATETSALIAIGLLYEGTGHRHMTEVCLSEIGRPPGPEVENCTDRESYSLSAGFALGMITFGQGNQLAHGALSDMEIPDLLYQHMIGGPKSALGDKIINNQQQHLQHQHQQQSFQVKEGDLLNVDVTSPGATLALGMMFFDTGNEAIAEWMNAPESQFLLEFVRPDFLMLRTISKGLIMWKKIVPTREWIESHVPSAILPYCLKKPSSDHPAGIDYETINQAYCNIIAGAAFVLGLRFAGTCNQQAFEILYDQADRLISISERSVSQLAGAATIEQAICVHVLALSLVMAGSGELEILRMIRHLRTRVGAKHSAVTYGSHMAIHMALGFLFLGGGRLTFSTSPRAISALIVSLFPKFPTHSNDNRYHLQALRHLFVLATEPRLIIPRDVLDNEFVGVHLELEFAETAWYDKQSVRMKAPFMMPELRFLSSVTLKDDRYHSFKFDSEKNFYILNHILNNHSGVLAVKRKVGCLSYEKDPEGMVSMTVNQRLVFNSFFTDKITRRHLGFFMAERNVRNFYQVFVESFMNKEYPSGLRRLLAPILNECASMERMELLPHFIDIVRAVYSPGDRGLLGSEGLKVSCFLRLTNLIYNYDDYLWPVLCKMLQKVVAVKLKKWENALACFKQWPDFSRASGREDLARIASFFNFFTLEDSVPPKLVGSSTYNIIQQTGDDFYVQLFASLLPQQGSDFQNLVEQTRKGVKELFVQKEHPDFLKEILKNTNKCNCK